MQLSLKYRNATQFILGDSQQKKNLQENLNANERKIRKKCDKKSVPRGCYTPSGNIGFIPWTLNITLRPSLEPFLTRFP